MGGLFHVNKMMLPVKASYFFVLGAVACFYPFLSVYMKHLGLSQSESGIIYGTMPLIGALVRPVFGILADKLQKHKLVLLICCALTGLLSGVCYTVPKVAKTTLEEVPDVGGNFTCNSGAISLQICEPNIKTGSGCGWGSSERDYISEGCVLHCQSMSSQSLTQVYSTNFSEIPTNENVSGFIGNFAESYPMNDFIMTNEGNSSDACRNFELLSVNGTKEVSGCHGLPPHRCKLSCPKTEKFGLTFGIFFAIFLMSYFFFAPVFSLIDAMTYSYLGEKRGEWGKQRLWGTIGFACSALVAGFFMHTFSATTADPNYLYMFIVSPLMFLAASVAVFFYKIDTAVTCKQVFKNTGSLLLQADVSLLLLMLLIFGMVTGVIEVFVFWFLKTLCASQLLLGLSVFMSCLPEIPILAVSGKVIQKIGEVNCLCVVCVVYALRMLAYSLLYNPWFVLAIEPLHGIAFGLMYSSATSYGSRITPPGMHGTIQGLIGAVHFGIGKGIGSLLGGVVSERVGIRWLFRSCSCLSLVALLLGILLHLSVIRKKRSQGGASKEQEDAGEVGTPMIDMSSASRGVSDKEDAKTSVNGSVPKDTDQSPMLNGSSRHGNHTEMA